jgi:peptide/nickel transport system ATP-binding protein
MNALNPVLDIGTQITDVLHAHNPLMTAPRARSRAVELLQLVGIASDRLHSYPHELSGGMRQRAIIAIALALDPEIIIMDEPTTALDVVVQRDILTQIMRLRNDFGFSVIFITHDLSLLLEIADTIAIMYAGRIAEIGSSKDLFRHPRHPYTYGLLNSFPNLRGPQSRLTGIPGSPPDLRSVPPGCAFHPRCAFAFAACHTIVPALHPVTREKVYRGVPLVDTLSVGEQVTCVACHLYDAELNPEGPPKRLESEHVN